MPRKKNISDLISGGDVGYCRKCMQVMPTIRFYESTNPMIDSNGRMSICRDCCTEIYNTYFSINNNVEKSLYLTCEDLDVRFSRDALNQTISHLENALSSNKKVDKVFGVYKSKLSSLSKENEGITSFRFRDSSDYESKGTEVKEVREEIIDNKLKLFWGKKYCIEDLEYLEMELSSWKATHKCDNQAELILIKEICIKQLEIMRDRDSNKPTSSSLDELQKLMKTASVDPAKANVASAGKSQDCWGLHVKDIEMFTPAEWFDQQEKYKDMDGFADYIKKYIYTPIVNFLTGKRDFGTEGSIDEEEDEDEDIEDVFERGES